MGADAPSRYSGGFMSVLDVVGSYYDAWMAGKGDFSAVPLAPDFSFTGPVASFDTAEGFREMAAQAGPMVTRFRIRRQLVDGDTVCSIIDWEMALPIAAMTSAEVLTVRDGQIVRGELIYDAQELRAAMAAGA
jgi:ketosteroid isomerase-like protein